MKLREMCNALGLRGSADCGLDMLKGRGDVVVFHRERAVTLSETRETGKRRDAVAVRRRSDWSKACRYRVQASRQASDKRMFLRDESTTESQLQVHERCQAETKMSSRCRVYKHCIQMQRL